MMSITCRPKPPGTAGALMMARLALVSCQLAHFRPAPKRIASLLGTICSGGQMGRLMQQADQGRQSKG